MLAPVVRPQATTSAHSAHRGHQPAVRHPPSTSLPAVDFSGSRGPFVRHQGSELPSRLGFPNGATFPIQINTKKMEHNADHPRVFRPGKSVGPSDTFNLDLPDKDKLYISDSEDSGAEDSGCDGPGSPSSSPSGSSAASSTLTMATTPAGNAAISSESSLFSASAAGGSQTRPSSILNDSRRSFSVTWGSTGGTFNVDTTDASAGAGAAATDGRQAPLEFLFRCPPAGELSKAAKVSEFCQHPVLASFMYAALAVERYAGNRDDSSFIETSGSLSGHQEFSFSTARTSIESSIRSPVEEPSQGRYTFEEPPSRSVVESSANSPVEAPAESTVGSSVGSETERIADGKPLEGESSDAKREEESEPPRARRGWRFATGLAGVAVGLAIGAAFVARRR